MFRLSRLVRRFGIEERVRDKIVKGLGPNTDCEVIDVSGGCGAMLHINVASDAFQGKNKVAQHRLVNKCIQDETLHGFKLETQAKN